MGSVYKAFDPYIKRVVAIKTIKLDQSRSEEDTSEFLQRFFLEAQISGILQHPGIVAIYDVGEQDGMPYIAMEYVEGKTLAEVVQRSPRPGLSFLTSVILQVANALEQAHSKGIVHRDLKPGNIMIANNGTAKIMDFGIAKMSGSNLTQTGVFLGTPSYSSPEQLKEGRVDHRSDIFSLGILAHETLTGHSPFPGQNISTILYKIASEPPTIAPNLKELPIDVPRWRRAFDKVLAKNPDQRYQNAAAFAADLVQCMNISQREKAGLEQLVERIDTTVNTARENLGFHQDIKRSDFEIAQGRATVPPTARKKSRGGLLALLVLMGIVAAGAGAYFTGYLDPVLGKYLPEMQAAVSEGPVEEVIKDEKPPTVKPLSKNVDITSQPAGATVYINDSQVGKTPYTHVFNGHAADTFAVRVSLDGFESQSRTITLTENMAAGLTFPLTRGSIRRTIETRPKGASVQVNNQDLGASPVQYAFSPGQSYTISAQESGYEPTSIRHTEDGASPDRITITLKKIPPPGTLKVDTEMSDFEIKVNGQTYKDTKVTLAPGSYEVVLACPSVFYRQTKNVTISSGKVQVLSTPIVITIPKINLVSGYGFVKIDGQYVKNSSGENDTTPIRNLRIATGPHQFEFLDKDGKIIAQKSTEVKRSEEILVDPNSAGPGN